MNRRVLILGGSRFIGYLTLCDLLAREFDVTLFNRQLRNPPDRFPKETKFVRGNRNNPSDMDRLFKANYDVVIDLSGYSPSHLNLIIPKFQSAIGQYIFVSSSTVYQTSFAGPLREDAPIILDQGTYAGDKALCEKLLLEAYHCNQFPVTIFRPQGVFGPYDPCQVGLIFYRLVNSIPILMPRCSNKRVNILYVYDLIKAINSSINNSKAYGKIYNLAGTEVVTLNQLVSLCVETSSTTPVLRFVDELVHMPEDKILKLRRHAGVFVDWPSVDEVLNVGRARSELGVVFTKLDQSLEETFSWLTSRVKNMKYFSMRGERQILMDYPVSNWQILLWGLIDKIANSWIAVKAVIKKLGVLNRFIKMFRFGLTK